MDYITLSASKKDKADCPYLYYKDYIERKIIDDSIVNATTPLYLLTGRFAHEVVEQYLYELIRNKMESDMDVFSETFDIVWKGNTYIPESEYDELRRFMFTEFAEKYALDLDGTFGTPEELANGKGCIEHAIAVDWDLNPCEWKDPKAFLRGKLDKITYRQDTIEITDWKSGRLVPSDTELLNSSAMMIYPLLAWAENKYIRKIRLVYHYIRFNVRKVFEFELSGTRDANNNIIGDIELITPKGHVIKAEERLRNFALRMAKKEADPTTKWFAVRSNACGICPHIRQCPLLDVGMAPIATKEDAERKAMRISALKDEIVLNTKELTEYIAIFQESVTTEDGVWDIAPPSMRIQGLKASALAEFLIENGLDLDQFLKVNTDKIKALPEDEIKAYIFGLADKISFSTRISLGEIQTTTGDKTSTRKATSKDVKFTEKNTMDKK